MPPNPHDGLPQKPVVSAALTTKRWLEWRMPALLVVALIVAVFALFWQTTWSMVSIWMRSETFTHGFLILPISAYLIWQRREDLLRCTPAPNWWGIPVMIVIGLGWLIAHSASVLVIEQLAMVAMVPTVVWALLGWQTTRVIIFPLFFLFFAVPMGEELIPPMMDFTANFTVSMLQLTGIPVYREGTFFEIPSGHWSVVEGCSGVRYLIASVTLGCLYAYLTYRSISRRLIFAVLAVIVPVIANGLRAYMIVMIAHLSDMRLALVVDHLIYGWVFFGVVMALLFWLGTFWREDIAERSPADLRHASLDTARSLNKRSLTAMSGAALAVMAIWPAMGYMHEEDNGPVVVSLGVPAAQGGWQPVAEPLSEWRPRYHGTDAVSDQTYQRGDRKVSVYVAYYRRQRQGAELINSQNVLIEQKHPVWRQTADSPHEVVLGGKRLEVREAKMRSAQQDLLVWYWYWIDGHTTTNHYLAKLWDAKAKLLGETGDAAAILVSAQFTDQGADAEQTLGDFMGAMRASIETNLENAAHE